MSAASSSATAPSVGRGWTQTGGRPHAEAVALAEAGEAARGATLYVTLEPCAHESERGPACADLLVDASRRASWWRSADPDPRTAGEGIARLEAAGIAVDVGPGAEQAASRWPASSAAIRLGRPFVTLKLALSVDGFIAPRPAKANGSPARPRAPMRIASAREADMILVGAAPMSRPPRLDVRLPGLEERCRGGLLTRGEAAEGWTRLAEPAGRSSASTRQDLLVEGGAGDRRRVPRRRTGRPAALYRAPIMFGEGIPAFRDPGPDGCPTAGAGAAPTRASLAATRSKSTSGPEAHVHRHRHRDRHDRQRRGPGRLARADRLPVRSGGRSPSALRSPVRACA